MAKIHFTLLEAKMRSQTGVNAPDAADAGGDTKTIGSSSALSDLTGQIGQTWRIVAGAEVFVNFGAGTPVAASDDGHMLTAGVPYEFNVAVASERCAFIESV